MKDVEAEICLCVLEVRCSPEGSPGPGFDLPQILHSGVFRRTNDKKHGGKRAGIRKSVLALLQVNNIKMALTSSAVLQE
jgi:hypothetical protein